MDNLENAETEASRFDLEAIAKDQITFYSDLMAMYEGTPMAVSSESFAHKDVRYHEIVRVFEGADFTVHDVGMGLGGFYDYLESRGILDRLGILYSGSEIVSSYVDEFRRRRPGVSIHCRNIVEEHPQESYDYLVLSGVFHQMRSTGVDKWEDYMRAILSSAYSVTRRAVIFNTTSPFVDYRTDGVYYPDLHDLLKWIRTKLGRFFSISHNYALYEMTLAVYKPDFIQRKFSQPEVQKYFSKS